MKWEVILRGFKTYLKLERSLSENTIHSYTHDIKLFIHFLEENGYQGVSPEQIEPKHIQEFLVWVTMSGKAAASQSRFLSGLRTFYKYLLTEELVNHDPTELIEGPRLSRRLPDVLSQDDILKIIQSVDLSKPEGHRNLAIVEILYGCGLRVSELINLQLSDLYFDQSYIRVIGKGNKQRWVPIGEQAIMAVNNYLNTARKILPVKKGHEGFVFLNRRGSKLTRVMIFYILKDLAQRAGIKKNIGPHTLRHSFATHMIENGANLRAVQEMLGHVSITTTEIYTHLNTGMLLEAIRKYHPLSRLK